jgi:hypothetical protein
MVMACDRAKLREAILAKVKGAAEPYSDRDLAIAVGHGHPVQNPRKHGYFISPAFRAVLGDLVGSGELELDDRPIYERPRVRLPGSLKAGLDAEAQASREPKLKTWIDPTMIDPAFRKPKQKERQGKPEIVKIKLPASLRKSEAGVSNLRRA